MMIYTANFRTDAEHAFHAIEAETPAQALRLARTLWEENPDAIEWHSYDMLQGLNEISIQDENDTVVAEWTDPDAQVCLAAPALLEALTQAVVALNTAPRFRVPSLDTDSYAVASLCDRALRAAKPSKE